MKLRNKVLAGLVLTSVVTTSVIANCGMYDGKKDGQRDGYNKSCHMDKKHHKKMGKKAGHKGGHILGMFKQLNLTDEQKTKIKEIMVESRKNVQTSDEAFTKNSFDKAKYLEIISQKRDNMLKSRADTLEKAYAVLTDKQKEQLKVLMDLRKEKMKSFQAKKLEKIEKKQ